MELADYLKVIRRRWWMVVLAMLVCTLAAGAASYTQKPSYTTSTRLLVGGVQGDSAIDEMSKRALATSRASAYARLATTGPAVAAAAQAAGVIGNAAPRVSAFADGESPFIVITVVANSAQSAQAIANAYVKALPSTINTLEQSSGALPNLTALESAGLPKAPSSPDHPRDLIVGLVVGIILGMAGALARETLDARLRDSSEIEKLTGTTLLGSVPKEHTGDPLPSMTRPRSGRAEAYRHVRTNLEFTTSEGMPRSVVVTSPAPGEGKSSLSTNLAIVAGRSGRNVVIVDADLRKPAVNKYFAVESSVGLSDVLSGRWRWQEALVPVPGENIHVLTSGPLPKFPSELVGSSSMVQLIQELEDHFDFVVIDTPPVLPVSDALVIGVNVGGVIVVARMVETRRAALKRAVEAVRKVNANLLGVVGNAVVRREEKAYGEGYGYAYGYINDSAAEQVPMPTLHPAERRDPVARRRGGRHATGEGAELADAEPPLLGQLPPPGWAGGAPAQPHRPAQQPYPPQQLSPPQQPYPPQQHYAPPTQPTAAQYVPTQQPYLSEPYPGPATAVSGSGSPGPWADFQSPSPVAPPLRLDDIIRRTERD